jgi:hypothetical protein
VNLHRSLGTADPLSDSAIAESIRDQTEYFSGLRSQQVGASRS